jgi:hypothetical protein
MRNRARYAFAAVSAAAVALSACSGSSHGHSSSAPASSTSPSSTSSSSTTPAGGSSSPKPHQPKPPSKNPLTGGKPTKNGVVAVKIDDTASGRPQVGIGKANIVYIEQVEAGLTRLAAIFNTSLPTVEAVRSTRASDPELMGPYGPIAYVTSGGSWSPLKILRHSVLKTSINDFGGPGFQRDPNRYAPYNLRANLAEIAKKLKAPTARPVGFHWSSSPSQLEGAKSGMQVRTVVGATPVAFNYDPKTHLYQRLIGGVVQRTAGGHIIAASDVLVQFCRVTTYAKDRDVNGVPSKFTWTMGHGKAVLFRGGKRLVGTWSRKKYHGETSFLTAKGQNMLFRPGQLWVVLAASNAPLAGP